MGRALLASVLLAAASVAAAAPEADLRTVGEISGYARTGRYDEVKRLCAAYAARWPRQVRCTEFGRTPEGRPMLALVASADGVLDTKTAAARGRPVLLFQGGIHAGEIDGKDAGFLALRELLEGTKLPGALGKVTVVFVPVFNVDGHERYGRWNRPNQRGPEEMGWRTTAQNLNLNRDYVKAEAPEMRAMLALLGSWDPILYVDLHVTDGAQFQPDISVQVEPCHGWEPGLDRTGCALRDQVLADLGRDGYLALPYYPSFMKEDDPPSGFNNWVSEPRFSTSYWATHNRFASLVETHSWKPYARRVAATHDTILSMVGLAAREGTQWVAEAKAADVRASKLAGQTVALSWRNTERTEMIDFPGYAYVREPSTVSGQDWIRYDESKPEAWHVPFYAEVVPKLEVAAPAHGYLVPPAWASLVADRLAAHGLRYEVLRDAQPDAPVEAFRATRTTWATESFEGRVPLAVVGRWRPETRGVPAGALFVPIDQPGARLVMSLLEPEAPDSLVSWGYFDAAFEQKEHMENYVIESVAREMLASDPQVRQEFERRLRDDPAFAADPTARLDWFYSRHPSWDDRYDLYPVYRR
ncbi:MAG: M14 family metallopeptidase [Steroidobacteraceae bacterium]